MNSVPSSFDISPDIHQACKTFRRQVKTIPPQSVNTYFSPGNIIKVPIATGTPNAWNDQKLMRLEFVLTLINPNPFIDYINLSEAGAASIIEQLSVNANNVAFEVIQDYNTYFTDFMRRFRPDLPKASFYVSNLDMNRLSVNYIKYPMIDCRTGVIMGNETSLFSSQDYNMSFSNEERAPYFPLSWNSGNNASMNPYNPNFFPDIIPAKPVDSAWFAHWGKETFEFLANAKCIPVGCTTNANQINGVTATTGYTYQGTANTSAYVTPTITNGQFVYQCSIPIISCTMGVNAPHPFPTFLADQLAFYLTLAQPSKIFQCTMDPVRIVRGTMRDFYTHNGNMNTLPNLGLDANTTAAASYFFDFLPYTKGSTFVDPTQTGSLTAGIYLPVTNGAPYATSYYGVVNQPTEIPNSNCEGFYQLIESNFVPGKTTNAMPGQQNNYSYPDHDMKICYPRAYINYTLGDNSPQFAQMAQSVGDYVQNTFAQYFFPAPDHVPYYYYMNSITQVGRQVNSLAFLPQDELGLVNAIPMGSCDTGCYGTFEYSSQPQVHRTFTNSYWTKDTSQYLNQDLQPTYQVSNVVLNQTQIILPPEITQMITQKVSANGTISMFLEGSQLVDTFITKKSASQDLILPINFLQLNNIRFLYRPEIYLGNSTEAFSYDSLRGVCPFTSITYDSSLVYRGKGSTVPLTYHSQPTNGQGGATMQLRIGDEYLPVTPLLGMQQIMNSYTSVFGDPTISSINVLAPVYRNEFVITADEQYTTTFIPTELLGDQTLTYLQQWNNFNWNNEVNYSNDAFNGIYPFPNTDDFIETLQTRMAAFTCTTDFPAVGPTYCSFFPYTYWATSLGYTQISNLVSSYDPYDGGQTQPTNYNPAFAYKLLAQNATVPQTQWYRLKSYIPPLSTFMAGFNLRLHPYETTRLNSGRFVGNANVIYSTTGLVLAETVDLRLTLLCNYVYRLDIRAGGTMYSFF